MPDAGVIRHNTLAVARRVRAERPHVIGAPTEGAQRMRAANASATQGTVSASTGAPESTDRAARGHGRMGRTARNNRQKEQH